jgi:hypothetical protein
MGGERVNPHEVIRRLVRAVRGLHYFTTVTEDNFHVVNEANAAIRDGEEFLSEWEEDDAEA